ncbi:MAG: hypothetical protein ABIG61_12205, partial [Planctomycetota bacterium]
EYLSESGWGTSEDNFGTSITVPEDNLGSIAISINDTNPNGYDCFIVDYFELVPIVNPDPSPSIYIQAEDCNLSGTAYFYGAPDVGPVIADPPPDGTGVGGMTLPVEIPAGEYYLYIKWQVISWDSGGTSQIGISGVTENNSNEANQLHTLYIGYSGTSPFYLDEIAGPSLGPGATSLNTSGWGITPGNFGTSITVPENNLGNITISISDDTSNGYNCFVVDYFVLKPVVTCPGDLDNSGLVEVNDLAIFVDQWLYCNDPNDPTCTDIMCAEKPAAGITEYTAYVPDGTVAIDGNSADWPAFDYDPNLWCTSHWVALDKLYTGDSYFVEDMYMCVMYDAAADIVYGAVMAHDYDPQYGYTAWNAQDDIEIYIQGDANNDTPTSPRGVWVNAQQFNVGLNSDKSTTYMIWANEADFITGPDPGLDAVVGLKVNSASDHELFYEFAAVPYDSYGGWDANEPTIQSDLYSGKEFGFDIVLGNYSPFMTSFGMHSAGIWTGSKSYDVTKYAVATCE